jgi:hypothetical protein
MGKKNNKKDILEKMDMRTLVFEVSEETTIDIYEVVPTDKSPAENETKTRNSVGFNIGWLLNQIDSDAKQRLAKSLSHRAKFRECPYIDCPNWISNYCATLSAYRDCKTYLQETSKKSKKSHSAGFVIGVEISAKGQNYK